MTKYSIILIFMIVFQVVAATDENFSIILFPDTQNMVSSNPQMWQSMPAWVKWAKENNSSLNIKAVIGLGDVTNSANEIEYSEAVKGWKVIKDSGLIYMPTRGNNGDMDDSLWDLHFGPKYFAGKTWFGGYDGSTTSCYYVKLENVSKKYKYLVLAVGPYPNTTQLLWAQDILNANRNSKVIVVAHSYLEFGLQRALTAEGKVLWDGLIRNNTNIFLVVCGHRYDLSYPSTSYYFLKDKRVNELRADYQDREDGEGYMEILKFQPSNYIIQTTAYSDYLNQTDPKRSYDPKGSYVMPLCLGIPLPKPRLVYEGKEVHANYTYYKLSVDNWNVYPASLFSPAPYLAPCGSNKNSSRMWVNISDQNKKVIISYCAFSKPSDLKLIRLWIEKGKKPPKSVSITLNDRACSISSQSDVVEIK
jgi:hypothetical protein